MSAEKYSVKFSMTPKSEPLSYPHQNQTALSLVPISRMLSFYCRVIMPKSK